jgi:hypothetical protein
MMDPPQVMIIVIPQAEFYPGVRPGGFAEFPEIPELPEKGHVKAVKIIAGEVKFGEIFIQVVFPVCSAVDVPNRQPRVFCHNPGALRGDFFITILLQFCVL